MSVNTGPGMSNRAIYSAALDLTEPALRQAYLDEACGDDRERRVQIEQLLAAHAIEQTNPLDKVIQQLGPEDTLASEPSGEKQLHGTLPPVIDRYKIREQIGEGGMGVVYVAEQTSPVRRKVALKIIKPGMDSQEVIARFEAERQALAMMDHPNIARVLDAATMDDGRPYFVMELVMGVPITEFCDDNQLNNRERLKLFIDVCSAVQHAHQKGIIHRDLKPSNIMVTMNDDRPMPKVIDFGIAKALSQSLTEHSVYTAYGQMVGTPVYMSPEQAQLNATDVDTRSDVYSLGVLLYELLTGSTPFDKETLQKSGFDEMRRMIREVDPPRPSQRVSTLRAEVLSTVAGRRRVDARKLSHALSGELDWIVMKSLEKDRRRRYQSSQEFAGDIERYLTDRPVEACPPSRWYSISKLAKRHRSALAAATLVLTAMLLGLVATTTQVFRARFAETALLASLANERQSRQQADAEAVLATQAAERADAEASVALAVNEFLRELFELTTIENQFEASLPPDPNITVRTLLDRASNSIEGRFSGAPQVEASINYTVGNVYLSLGVLEAAAGHLERAEAIARNVVGLEHPGTARAIGALARLRTEQGRLADAEILAREAFQLSIRLEGDASPDAHQHMAGLIVVLFEAGKFEEAKTLAAQQLEMCREQFGSNDNRTLTAMGNLASQLSKLGDRTEACRLIQDVLEVRENQLGATHPETLRSLAGLAVQLDDLGDYAKASEIFERVLREYLALYGPQHPQTLLCQANLGHVYTMQLKLDEALKVLEPALQIAEQQLGSDNSITLIALGYLAKAYEERKEFDQAITTYRKLLKIEVATLGEGHLSVISTRSNLAGTLFNMGKFTESEQEFASVLEAAQTYLGKTHYLTQKIINNAAVKMQAAGKNQAAMDAFQMLFESHLQKQGPNAIETLNAEFNIVYVRHELGQRADALQELEALIVRLDEHLDASHPLRLVAHMRHGFVLKGNVAIEDRHERAAVAYRQAFDGYLQSLGRFHAKTLDAMESHAIELYAADRADEADAFIDLQMAETLRQYDPTDSHALQLEQSAAKVMLRAKRTDSAIPFLLHIYDATSHQLGADDKKTLEVVRQLLQAYKANDELAQAEALANNYLQSLEQIAVPRRGSIIEAEFLLIDLQMGREDVIEAEKRLTNILARQSNLFDPVSSEAAAIHSRLAEVFERSDRYAESERERRMEYQIKSELLGPSHLSTLTALAGLRMPLIELERYDEAEAVLQEVIRHHEARSGSTTLSSSYHRNLLVRLYLAQGRFAEAERMSRENFKLAASPENLRSLTSWQNHANLAIALDQQGRRQEAEQHLREALVSVTAGGFDVRTNQYATVSLALVNLLLLQDRVTEAVLLTRTNHDAQLDPAGGLNFNTIQINFYFAKALHADQQFEESEPLLRELLGAKGKLKSRPLILFETMSMLGECLLIQNRLQESEPMLLEGYSGLERRVPRETLSKPERQRTCRAAADRLVRLYEGTKNDAQLERWRAVREQWTSPH